MSLPPVGFVGAGMMGAGMAGCLLEAGHPVCLRSHRNRAPVEALLARGATEATGVDALLAQSEVIVTCLPNADTVRALADEILPHMRAGQIWIDTTTSRPETSVEIAARVTARGASFADAPVTGGPPQAEAGELVSLVGCAEAEFDRVSAFVAPYSKNVRRFGAVGRGHAAKLLNNLVTQGTLLLLADAYQCAARIGVDPRALYEVMLEGAARSGTLEKSVGPALDGAFDGSKFTIANAAKDLRYAAELLASADPPRADLARSMAARLGDLAEQGHGEAFVSTMLDPSR